MDAPRLKQIKALLKGYSPASFVKDLVRGTPILLLVGPTGAGKDSLKDRLMETGRYYHIVSHTTRQPRINVGVLEKDGEDYNFTDITTMQKLLAEKRMIEAKIYSGNIYGTSVDQIEKAQNQDKVAMTDMEVQGVKEYKQLDPGVLAVFILPPDFKTWQRRLQRRYGDVVDAADYRRRLKTALAEIHELLSTNFYIPVVNKDLELLFKEVEAIVQAGGQSSHTEQARKVAEQLKIDIQNYLTS